MNKLKSKSLKNNSLSSKEKTTATKTIHPIQYSWGIVIALVAFCLFANSIMHGYVLDDSGAITQNRYVQEGFHGIPKLLKVDFWHFSNVHLGYYRPLSLITFAIEYHFFQSNPQVSHFFNVLLFALSGFLLFIVLCKVFKHFNPLFSFFITLLFIAHPIHTEVIDNIKSRDELLSFFNTLVMLWLVLRYKDSKKPIFLIISLFSCYLAMLSKESAITGVLLIPFVLYYYSDSIIESIKSTIPFFLVVILFFIQKKFFLGTLSGIIPDDIVNYPYTKASVKLPTTFMLFVFSLRLLFIPHPLRYDYSFNQIPAVHFNNGWALLGIILFFAGVLVWHIWWLVAVAFVGAWAVFVVAAWRDEHEEAIPAATVASVDRANRAAREAALPTLRSAS